MNIVFFAFLPALAHLLHWREALPLALLAGAGYYVTLSFFLRVGSLFPFPLKRLAFILWLAAFGQIAWYLWNVSWSWILSLFILMPRELLKKRPKSLRLEEWIRGVVFFLLVVCLNVLKEIFSAQLSLELFKSPAGLLMLFAFVSLFFKNSKPQESTKNV